MRIGTIRTPQRTTNQEQNCGQFPRIVNCGERNQSPNLNVAHDIMQLSLTNHCDGRLRTDSLPL